jgi:hypothetical protein
LRRGGRRTGFRRAKSREEDLDPVAFARQRLQFEPDEKQELALRGGRRGIVLCSRQWGKSTVMAAKAVHRAYSEPKSLTLLLSPCGRQSSEFMVKAARFVSKLGIRAKGDGGNDLSIVFPNRSRIVGLPESEDKVRGFSDVSLLLIDEASRVTDGLYRAMRPTLAVGDGDLWLMSTPNGKQGFFWEEWQNGGPDWERIKVTAPECPRISKRFLEEEKATGGDKWYRQEYLCEFVEREGRVFSQESIEAAMQDFEPLYL